VKLKKTGLGTSAVHAGEVRPGIGGAVSMPIFQSSTFENDGDAGYHDVRYIRLNNTPNHDVLHAKLAVLEGAEAALVAGSGMAAISTTLMTFLSSGDHVMHQHALYGGTHSFIQHDLKDFGIDHGDVDPTRQETWEAIRTDRTRVFYVETLSNPLMTVPDLQAVVDFCRQHGIVSVIDNTFASPVNFLPIPFGFDLVLHSCTKYMNGHTDIVAGSIAGSAEKIAAIKHKLDHLGGTLDPHACFLLHRGMKTLPLRMRHQNKSALEMARFLAEQERVIRVNHPGLPGSPDHERAKTYLHGTGGMLSFEVEGGAAAADRMFSRLQLPIVAPSLGGVETLVTRPVTTSHAGLSAAELERANISEGLVRVSVGIEDTEDLIADFRRALS